MAHNTDWFEGQRWSLFHDDEEMHRRCYLRRVAILLLIVIGLAMVPLWANAQTHDVVVHSVEVDGLKLRLLSSPCADPSSLILISNAPPKFRQGWRASSSDWRMRDGSWRTYDGCWLEISKEVAGAEDDVLIFVFSDGMTSQGLKRDVLRKPEPGA